MGIKIIGRLFPNAEHWKWMLSTNDDDGSSSSTRYKIPVSMANVMCLCAFVWECSRHCACVRIHESLSIEFRYCVRHLYTAVSTVGINNNNNNTRLTNGNRMEKENERIITAAGVAAVASTTAKNNRTDERINSNKIGIQIEIKLLRAMQEGRLDCEQAEQRRHIPHLSSSTLYAIVSSCEMIKRTCFPILSVHSPFVAFPVPEERSHFNESSASFFSSSSTSSSPPLHEHKHIHTVKHVWDVDEHLRTPHRHTHTKKVKQNVK